MGVRHVALFGSRVGIRQDVEDRLTVLFGHPVDIADEETLRDALKPLYERDKIRAF